MKKKIGIIEGLFRYPVKSMRGESVREVDLSWHGLNGDRRLAFRRIGDQQGFPWLTASRFPGLILFESVRRGEAANDLPTHVRLPDGVELALFDSKLAAEVTDRSGVAVEMTHMNRGVFDEAAVSAITSATIREISQLSGEQPDVRRFRPNILISSLHSLPFEEDEWVGAVLSFGEAESAPAIAITNWDERCAMVNFDPETGLSSPEVLKTIVRERDNKAGIYAAVIRPGRLAINQSIYLTRSTNSG
jgi:uncharacterized protein YcbX